MQSVEVAPWLRKAAGYAWRLLLVAAAAAVVVFALSRLMLLVVAVLAALFLAALLDTPACWLRKRGVPAWAATVLTLLGAMGVVVGAGMLIVPSLIDQISDLDDNLLRGLNRLEVLLAGALPVSEADLRSAVSSAINALQAQLQQITTGYVAVAQRVAEVLVGLFIALFALFFFLKDGRSIFEGLCGLLPQRHRGDATAMGERSWHVLQRYLQGLGFVALVDATLVGLALVLIGVPLALPLALITFLGAFVPLVGAIVAGLLAALVALVSGDVVDALLVVGAILVIEQLEGNLLYPLIVGRRVKLHPLTILLAVTAGGLLAGILGAFLAVPVAAIVATSFTYLRSRDHQPRDDPKAADDAVQPQRPAPEVPGPSSQRLAEA